MKKFPKELYVTIDGDKGEEYFLATESLAGVAEIGEKIVMAVYVLDHIATVTTSIETKRK